MPKDDLTSQSATAHQPDAVAFGGPGTSLPDRRWLLASTLGGAGIAAAGWGVNVAFGLPTIESIGINVGTAVGLAGVVWVMERRFERRVGRRIEQQAASLEKQIGTIADKVSPPRRKERIRPRNEVLQEYRRLVRERAPADFADEAAVVADRARRKREHDEQIAAIEERVRAEVDSDKQSEYWSLKQILARGRLLKANPPPFPNYHPFPADNLDPVEPVRDWWDGRFTVAELGPELAARLEIAALYSLTADATNALPVYHRTAIACDELLAVALDGFMEHFPHERTASAATNDRSESGLRMSQVRSDRIPPTIAHCVEALKRAIDESEHQTRKIDSHPWSEVQAEFPAAISEAESRQDVVFDLYAPYDEDAYRPPLRIALGIYESAGTGFRGWAPTSCVFRLVQITRDAVIALRLPNVSLPEIVASGSAHRARTVDLSPAKSGRYVWGSTSG